MGANIMRFLTVLTVVVFAATTSHAAPWTPELTNTACWFDADDASTIQTSGNAVTNWLDKSGNDRHVLQANASYQPTNTSINSRNAIGFNNDKLLTTNTATWLNNTNYHFIAVLQHYMSTSDGYYIGTADSGLQDRVLHIGQRDSTSWKHGHFGDDATYSHTLDTTPLLAVNSFNNSGSDAFMNGTSIGSSVGPGYALITEGPLSMGGKIVGKGYYVGAIGEVICVLGDLSTEGRQLFEGYLAHKWGLAANLPAGHPYKSDAPTVPDPGTVLIIR